MPIEQGILAYIQSNPDDTELDLSAEDCTEDDYQQLAQVLTNNTHLRRILWKKVPPLNNQAVDKIYELLARNNKQAKVHIEKNKLPQASSLFRQSLEDADNLLKNQLQAQNAVGSDLTLASHGHDSHYWYSLQDMQVLLQGVRQGKLIYQQPPKAPYPYKSGEEYAAIRENQQGIWLTEPYYAQVFAESLLDDIKTITGQHTIDNEGNSLQAKNNRWQSMPRLIIIPLLSDNHWRALRMEFNYQAKKVAILWDDPYGPSHFGETLKQSLLDTLKQAITILFRIQLQTDKLVFDEEVLQQQDKVLIQQGRQAPSDFLEVELEHNSWDCGPIIVSNCSDYCTVGLANQDFINQPQHYTIQPPDTINYLISIDSLRLQQRNTYCKITQTTPAHPMEYGGNSRKRDDYSVPLIMISSKEKSLAQTLFEAAKKFYQSSKFDKAIEPLQTILSLPKDSTQPGVWQADVYYQLACCYALLSSQSFDDTKSHIEKAKQYFEDALKSGDFGLSGLTHRIRCDYGCFLYQHKYYQEAYQQSQAVILANSKAKWLNYPSLEQTLLPCSIQTSFHRLALEKITDRTLAYQLSLLSFQAENQPELISIVFSDFIGETYQGIDPVAFDLAAQYYEQQNQIEKANQAYHHSQWAKAELQSVETIKTLQAALSRRLMPIPVTQNEVDEGSSDASEPMLYAQLAKTFEFMGDIYLNKQSYTKAAGLYAMAAHIYQCQVGQKVGLLDEKRLAVELELITNSLLNYALLPTLDTWRKQQARYHQQLTNIRGQARQALNESLIDLSEKPEEDLDKKIAVVQNIFADIANGMHGLLQAMLKDCYTALGKPPCSYAVLGLGSFARQEMTPYSDLEWAIVIENAEYRHYFQQVAELLSVKVTCLGETILPSLAIESLNPEYTENTWQFFDKLIPRGFAMDGAMAQACKTPQGKKDRKGRPVFTLLGTPEELAVYLSYTDKGSYWFEQQQAMTLPTVLMNAILIEGDSELFLAYRARLLQALQYIPNDSQQPLYQYLMHKLLDNNLKEFIPNVGDAGELFNAKKSFYRIPNLIIDELALHYGVDLVYCSGFAKLTALEQEKILQAKTAQRLRYVLSETMYFRLQTYCHYSAQVEGMDPLQKSMLLEYKKDESYTVDTKNLPRIEHILQILLPLYETMQHFHQSPANSKNLLNKATFFDNSAITRGKIAIRLHQYKKAKQIFQQAVIEEQSSQPTKPSLGKIYDLLGYIEERLGNMEKAIVYKQQVLAIYIRLYGDQHPKIVLALHNVGFAYLASDNHKQALNYLLKALTIRNDLPLDIHAVLLESIGQAYVGLGQARNALTFFQQALAINRKLYAKSDQELAKTLTNLGSTYNVLGNASQALVCYQEALAINKQIYGEQHPIIGKALHNLGAIYNHFGYAKKALIYYQQALVIMRGAYGKIHPDVTSALAGIGATYATSLNDPKKALVYYQQALAINKQIYGELHPNIATLLKYIGAAYDMLGQPKQALIYLQQALAISRNWYDEKHPDVATTLNNIGLTYETLNDNSQALIYLNWALTINNKLYGQNHPEVAKSLNNIGTAYYSSGDFKNALNYYKQALDIEKQIAGENHPHVAVLLSNIGGIYQAQGDTKQALDVHQKALAIIEGLYGERHPLIAAILNSMGLALCYLDKAEEALELCQKAVAIWKFFYDEPHPDVAKALNNLGAASYALNDSEQALIFYQQALSIQTQLYSEQHPDVIITLNNIGRIYNSQKMLEDAMRYYKRAEAIWEQMGRKFFPYIDGLLTNIGAIYYELNKLNEALNYYCQALDIKKFMYGNQSPQVIFALNNMIKVYKALNDSTGAIDCYKEILDIEKQIYGEQHPNLALTLFDIGLICYDEGQADTALSYLQKALIIIEKHYGDQSLPFASALNNIGLVYDSIGNTNLALTHLQRAINIQKQVCGEQHPDTEITRDNIEKLLSSQVQKVSSSFNNAKDEDIEYMAGFKSGFFNRSSKQSINYNIKQPKSNIILRLFNELTGLAFTGYFRMGEDFVLDAVLTCHDKKTCKDYEEVLKHYTIQYEVKPIDNNIFYLIVPEINSTQVGNWITAKYNEIANNQSSDKFKYSK